MAPLTSTLAFLGLLLSFGVRPAFADEGHAMWIQYNDNACSDYAGSYSVPYVDNVYSDPAECLQWEIDGTLSASISSCDSEFNDGCSCTFYQNSDCSDYPVLSQQNTYWVPNGYHLNCAKNNGSPFQAFKCFVNAPL